MSRRKLKYRSAVVTLSLWKGWLANAQMLRQAQHDNLLMSGEKSKCRSHAELVSASPETLRRVQGNSVLSHRAQSRRGK
jgi:hypothetical protein